MKFKKLLLTFSAVVFCVVSSGQGAANFHFRSIEVDDGLASNTIYSMLQDSEGFMWFGTKDGLCKYDGDKFVTFRKDPSAPNSLGNNFIRAMIEDDNGMLYVGTRSGLYRMDMEEESFVKIPIDTGNGVEILPEIPTLHRDRSGNLWVGTEMNGIFILESQTGKLRPVRIGKYEAETRQNITWHITSDKYGAVWVGNRLGLLKYDREKDVLEPSPSMFGVTDAPKNEVMCVLDDEKGNMWLGTWESGIRRYNKKTHEYTSFFGPGDRSCYISKIHALFEFTVHSLLIGSADGLYLFNTETYAIQRLDSPEQPSGVSDQNIYSFTKDREGGIWIGTYFGGVNYLNTASLDIYTYFQAGRDKTPLGVSEFCEDGVGNLWVGTENKGVHYFDTKAQTLTQLKNTSDLKIRGLMMDGKNLWIGTLSKGLDVYDTRTGALSNFRHRSGDECSLYDNSVFSICKTSGGDIYVGTKTGLNIYDPATGRFGRVPETNGCFIYDMKEDAYGNLWFATYGFGVRRLDLKGNRWYSYDQSQHPENPSAISNLISVHIDDLNRVFFTSEGEGIYIYNYATDTFANLSEKDGLPNNVTYGILDDPSGTLWVSCNKGIVRFNPSTPRQYKIYDKEDGLAGSQLNYKSRYKASDGKFYFGCLSGFSCFYPQDLKKIKNETVPPIVITQLRLLGDVPPEVNHDLQVKVNKKQKIRLPYDRSSFSVSFTSLSYISKSKNRYSYILEGADSGWTDADSKNVTYVNLAPGKYVFRVRGSNNDGVWNYDGAAVEIEIQPPFWASTMALVLYLLLFISLAYALAVYYQRKQRAKQLRHLESYRIEQETLAFQSKINFFGTIAHEIRTPLTLISAPLEELINSGGGNEEAQRNLSVIEKNCARLTALVKQMLDFRKMDSTQYVVNPEYVDLREYITGLYERFRKTADKKGIDFTLHMPQEPSLHVRTDTDAMTKIIGNLLTNAMKFTVDRVVLSLSANVDGTYTVRVEDNGKGVADEYKQLIFDPFYQISAEDGKRGYGIGLALVRNLAEVLNGTIGVRDGESGGASFEFTFASFPSDELADDTSVNIEPFLVDRAIATGADSRFSVLIVEDNADMGEFIKNSLRQDYIAVTAPDASTALEILKKESFDIIISDIMMPGMDGITFISKLKDDFNLRHIPVIILSAKTENAAKVSGLLSGADVFIEKPFSVSHLRAQIASLLENRRAILDAFNSSPFFSYSTLANNEKDSEFITKLNDEIAKNIADENFSVESLTNVLGISRSNLQRKLKSICGVSPGDYLRNFRLQNACKLLSETDIRVNEVAYMVGFSSASYFSKAFQKRYNMSPKEFMNQYRQGRNTPEGEEDSSV